MDEKLTCQRMLRILDSRDNQNRPLYLNKRCGKPASEIEIKGSLTVAKAILCQKHAEQADADAFLSKNGFPKGKIADTKANQGYQQTRIDPAIK